ncbi:hypothetical protein L2E82_27580 [Cichorium intybus]|uniref:Uncharacterized protein n=1 Tax=Cichorium intybus TaxID=13427 RepID=A0ACB9CT91_CICIN|nr:hypothetical protein L2E82_27580 [Cichorium intybus]
MSDDFRQQGDFRQSANFRRKTINGVTTNDIKRLEEKKDAVRGTGNSQEKGYIEKVEVIQPRIRSEVKSVDISPEDGIAAAKSLSSKLIGEKETNYTTETEEEEDSEDEDFFLTSDEESQASAEFADARTKKSPNEPELSTIASDGCTNVSFSDEEDEQYDLDEDEDSLVQESVFEVAFNENSPHAEDKTEGHATVAEVSDVRENPKIHINEEENITDTAFNSFACVPNDEPGDKKERHDFLDEGSNASNTPKKK